MGRAGRCYKQEFLLKFARDRTRVLTNPISPLKMDI